MRDRKLPSFLTFLFLPALFFLVFSACVFFNNRSFRQFTGQIFRSELAGNTLNLHYTLKHPENYGISEAPVTLGSAEPKSWRLPAWFWKITRRRCAVFPTRHSPKPTG